VFALLAFAFATPSTFAVTAGISDTSILIGSCSALDGLPPPRSTFHWPQEETIPVVGLSPERSYSTNP